MRITWFEAARQDVENAGPVIRDQIDSELPVMFADSVPGSAAHLTTGLLMVELPCGVEVDFERTGDGIRIAYVKF